MGKISKGDIQRMIELIAKRANLPTTKEQAIEANKPKYLEYNYNPCYGGYELVLTNTQGCSQTWAFGGNYGRMTTKVFYMYLQGLYNGLIYNK